MLALIGAFSAIAMRHGNAAAALANRDYQFLQSEFGFARDGFVLKNISPTDIERLTRVMHDPAFSADRQSLRFNLATLLLYIERNTCQEWEETHHSSPCPEVSDPRFLPGWAVAERRCIACHLTGTTLASPFVRMVREKNVDEHFLASALNDTHAMSRIGLSQEDLSDLSAYINSLR
jgi:hypothetical protein